MRPRTCVFLPSRVDDSWDPEFLLRLRGFDCLFEGDVIAESVLAFETQPHGDALRLERGVIERERLASHARPPDAIDATTSQFLLRKTDRVHLHHLTFHVARREYSYVMVDDLAIFKVRMVEVHQSVLRFQHIIQKVVLADLVVAAVALL